jgi:hypothetical protein
MTSGFSKMISKARPGGDDEARDIVTHLLVHGADDEDGDAERGEFGAERFGFGGRERAGEFVGDLDGLDVVAAGALARVRFGGPGDEGLGGGGGDGGRPRGAREIAEAFRGGGDLLVAGDEGVEGGEDFFGFAFRGDGGADRVALDGGDDVVGALDIGDRHREDRHHAFVGGGA